MGSERRSGRAESHVSYFFILGMNDLLELIYLVFFAAIAGGAFALMTQNLRNSQERDSLQAPRKRSRVHPEAPQAGEEVLYVDFSRERLEQIFQQTP
jgi:hypothetical protein